MAANDNIVQCRSLGAEAHAHLALLYHARASVLGASSHSAAERHVMALCASILNVSAHAVLSAHARRTVRSAAAALGNRLRAAGAANLAARIHKCVTELARNTPPPTADERAALRAALAHERAERSREVEQLRTDLAALRAELTPSKDAQCDEKHAEDADFELDVLDLTASDSNAGDDSQNEYGDPLALVPSGSSSSSAPLGRKRVSLNSVRRALQFDGEPGAYWTQPLPSKRRRCRPRE